MRSGGRFLGAVLSVLSVLSCFSPPAQARFRGGGGGVSFFFARSLSRSDFLLFIPTRGDSTLATAFSYYAATVVLNAEGDSLVSDETLEGLGTAGSFFYALFGSLLKLAQPAAVAEPQAAVSSRPSEEAESAILLAPQPSPPPPIRDDDDDDDSSSSRAGAYELEDGEQLDGGELVDDDEDEDDDDDKLQKGGRGLRNGVKMKNKLTQYMPHPGYFVAGALAGGISRTATAPFDRLKVYLLVSTRAGSNASINAVRHGHPLAGLHNAARPITEAVASLYRAGGLRTFFAGVCVDVERVLRGC